MTQDTGTTGGGTFVRPVGLRGAAAPRTALRRPAACVALLLALALLAGPGLPQAAGAQIADTEQMRVVAGMGHGDGLPAERASLVGPRGVALGPDGLLYIADFWHHQVRRVRTDGTIERVAGSVEGYGGDGGAAAKARLNRPMGLAFGPGGDLFISDAGNNRIRRIDAATGRISTVAGDGRRTFGGDGGPAVQASLAFPHDVAVAGDGTLFIADHENIVVRRVSPAGIISTYAGNRLGVPTPDGTPAQQAGLDGPTGVALDAAGNLFISDYVRLPGESVCAVRRVDGASQRMTTVAGGGACGDSGDGGPATAAQLSYPTQLVAAADGRLFIADTDNGRVRVIGADGTITTAAGGDKGCATGAPGAATAFTNPFGLNLGPDGTLYVADALCGRVYGAGAAGLSMLAGNGTALAGEDGDPATALTVASFGGGLPDYGGVRAVAWAPQGGFVFAEKTQIWHVDAAGRARVLAGARQEGHADGSARDARFGQVRGLAYDAAGTLWIADSGSGSNGSRIKVLRDGAVTTVAGDGNPQGMPGLEGPALSVALHTVGDVAAAADGSVFFTEEQRQGRVRVLRDGAVSTVAGQSEGNVYVYYAGDEGPARKARLQYPRGLDIGPDGALYVADLGNNRVRRIHPASPDGVITTVAGDGGHENRGDGSLAVLASTQSPEHVAVSPEGDLFVTDTRNYSYDPSAFSIRHVAPNGVIATVAGTGTSTTGPDGPARGSALLSPSGLAVGPLGLLIADGTTVRLLTAAAAGWPRPERIVVCEPPIIDPAGDAWLRTIGVNHPSVSRPWIDVLEARPRTVDGALEVTIQLEDLSEAAYTPPGWLGGAWNWLYVFETTVGTHPRYGYLAATAPYSLAQGTSAPGFTFEYGIAALGSSGSWPFAQRLGAAVGTVDFVTDRITLRAPLAALGLADADHVIYHEANGGVLVETPFSRYHQMHDRSPDGWDYGSRRSYRIGRNCPEAF